MTLAPGGRLGPYEVLSKLGEGGMGVVFRGRDVQLDREVALKALPEGLTDDAERMQRFEREAKVLAQLNHPNIAQIYGVATNGEDRALVMELVDGPTLADHLASGAPSLAESLEIGRQIAEALEAAHEKGIVHRDLKPQNVKLTSEGKVKVLDFGLAKAIDASAGGVSSVSQLAQSPTLSMGATMQGVILGTAAYMSPEQARGAVVDKRSDIWSFGVLLYEMLARRSLFGGETLSDTLAGVLRGEVDLATLPPAVPASVRRLLARCLERDPRLRLRDIGEARIALGGALAGRPEAGTDASLTRAPAPASRKGSWVAGVAAAAGLTAMLVLAALALRRPAPTPSRFATVSVRLPPNVLLPLDDRGIYGQTAILAIAPDGDRVAFIGGIGAEGRIYTRALESPEVVPVEGAEGGSSPFFSPDGRWLGFFAGGKMRKVLLSGGRPIDLTDASLDRGAVWCPDGSIVFPPGVAAGLVRVPADGGTPVPLTTLAEGERTHRWPALLPSGKEVAFTVGLVGQPGDYESSAIDVVDLQSGKRRPYLRGASMVRFTASGHVLLGGERHVRALPLTVAETLQGRGIEAASVVLRGVAGVPSSGIVHFDVARDGTLIYAERDPRAAQSVLAWLERDGRLQDLPFAPLEYRVPVLAPDGRRAAVGVGPGGGRSSDIWVHEFASGALTRLTFDERSFSPAWSRDGRSVLYTVIEPGGGEVFAQRIADGSAEAVELHRFPSGGARTVVGTMADGSLLFWEDGGAGTAGNLLYLPAGSHEPHPFVSTAAIEILGTASPDGRHVAYAADNTGTVQIYLEPFPSTGAKWHIAADATAPRFSRDGGTLFYLSGRRMMALPISLRGTFSRGTPRELFEMPPTVALVTDTYSNYDIAPDGRFLVARSTSDTFTAGHLAISFNWFEELRRLAP